MNVRVIVFVCLCLFGSVGLGSAGWVDSSSIEAGLPDVGYNSAPSVFNYSGELYMISGSHARKFNGFKYNGTSWVSNSTIAAGLSTPNSRPAPSVFSHSGELYMILGLFNGTFAGFKYNGTSWVSNSAIAAGLPAFGSDLTPSVFYYCGELYLISGQFGGTFAGFKYNGTSWVSNSAIAAGLPDIGYRSTPSVFNHSGELYLISGSLYGRNINGFKYNGTSWVSNSTIAAGVSDIGYRLTPSVFNYSSELYMISGETDGVFHGFLFNCIPTIPSIVSPTYNEYFTTEPITLNVSSSDADGDSITYYLYGDVTDGITLINISTTGTYLWDITNSAPHYWKVRAYDGYAYSANTSLQKFTVLLPPVLLTPTNTSTATYPFPPMFHDVVLSWENLSTLSYKYQVSSDINFNLVSAENTITTNTTTVSLVADDYYWRVYSYDESGDEYSNASDVWQFTVNETKSSDGTAIDGVVYEVLSGGSVAIDDALINIWNDTWSSSSIVGENGYFFFGGLSNSTYYLKATKAGYNEGVVEVVTSINDETTTRNILLQTTSGSGIEYAEHFVKFIVKSVWGEKYEGVTVKVYVGDAVVSTYTGTTGTDGSITFNLDEDQEYRLTFVKVSAGIDEEITLYPVNTEYNVYVYDTLLPDDDDVESEEITVSVTTCEINDTHAEISVTYTDAMAETTSLKIYVNQSDEDDPVNQTVITSVDLGATSSTTHTFTISDYTGQAYFINVIAGHTTFGDVFRTYSVRFDGMAEDWGFSRIWVYMGVAGMMFIGGLFKASKAEQGALIVCVAGWLFIVMGWFDSLGSAAVLSMKAGLGLATIIAIMANMAKKDRDETV